MSDIKKQDNPSNLIQIAIEKNAPLENLEKLMDLQERWERNEARKAFFRAKTDFQKNKPPIKKTEKVEFKSTKFFFATLSEIQKAVDPVLADFGLSYDWKQTQKNNQIEITCVLSHELGHSESTYLAAPHDTSGGKNSIQSIGSTVSYLKRYTLENSLGLSGDKDDDGKGAPTHDNAKALAMRDELMNLYMEKYQVLKEKLTEDQINMLDGIIKNKEVNRYQSAITSLKKY